MLTQEISKKLRASNLEPIPFDEVIVHKVMQLEIFDMAKVPARDLITLKDLQTSGCGYTITSILRWWC
jgi:hypothetical protein